MNWFFFATLAQSLFGLSSAVDKVVLQKALPKPASNTFYLALFGLFAFVLAPFGFGWGDPLWVGIALVTGALVILGFFAYFWALSQKDASHILPIIFGWQPIATLLFTSLLLPERMSPISSIGLILLLAGTLTLAYEHHEGKRIVRLAPLGAAALAVLLFGCTNTLGKLIYANLGFVNGFLWVKIGAVLLAVSFLFMPKLRKQALQKTDRRGGALFIANRVVAGIASLLFNLALISGNPAIIDGLGGMSLMVIFFVTLALHRWAPHILRERFDRHAIVQKSVATGLIMLGVFLVR